MGKFSAANTTSVLLERELAAADSAKVLKNTSKTLCRDTAYLIGESLIETLVQILGDEALNLGIVLWRRETSAVASGRLDWETSTYEKQ